MELALGLSGLVFLAIFERLRHSKHSLAIDMMSSDKSLTPALVILKKDNKKFNFLFIKIFKQDVLDWNLFLKLALLSDVDATKKNLRRIRFLKSVESVSLLAAVTFLLVLAVVNQE